ncbi:hypothetical protein BDW72DRAFT_45741 [Aspergillus terricola var. indicus]
MDETIMPQEANPLSQALELLQGIVDIMCSHAIDLDCDEFHATISRLCEEAPASAQQIMHMIQRNIARPDPKLSARSKRKPRGDPSYRPTKKPQVNKSRPPDPLDTSCIRKPINNDYQKTQRLKPSEVTATQSPNQSMEDTPAVVNKLRPRDCPEPMHVRIDPPSEDGMPAIPRVTIIATDQAIDIISGLAMCWGKTPVDEVHRCILRSIKGDKDATHKVWPWKHLLEERWSENLKLRIFGMLEYMGASDWYEREIQRVMGEERTKENQPVGRRGAAIIVLNRLLSIQSDQDRCHEESGVAVEVTENKRKRFTLHFSRGRKLHSLIQKFGRGILFSPKIWYVNIPFDICAVNIGRTYVKMGNKDLNNVLKAKADSPELLKLLEEQLDAMIETGSPDFYGFLQSLQDNAIISDNDHRALRTDLARKCDNKVGPALEKASIMEDTRSIGDDGQRGQGTSGKLFIAGGPINDFR